MPAAKVPAYFNGHFKVVQKSLVVVEEVLDFFEAASEAG